MGGIRHQIRSVGHCLDLLAQLRVQGRQLSDTGLLGERVSQVEGKVLQGRSRLTETRDVEALAPKLRGGPCQLPQPNARLTSRLRISGSDRHRDGGFHVVVVVAGIMGDRHVTCLPQGTYDAGAQPRPDQPGRVVARLAQTGEQLVRAVEQAPHRAIDISHEFLLHGRALR